MKIEEYEELRAPDPERLRVDYYGSRYYCDRIDVEDELRPEGPMKWNPKKKGASIEEGHALPAQSTITKAIPSDALLYWAVGKTAEAAVDQRGKWSGLDRDDAIDYLKKAHRKESGKAADRGGSVHDYLEAKLLGKTGGALTMGEEAKRYLPVVDLFLYEQNPELLLAEIVGIGHRHGVTTDAVLRLPGLDLPHEWNVLDWKTRNDTVRVPHTVYEKEVAQLGANLDLRYWIAQRGDELVRVPLLDDLGAVLVTFTPTSYAIHVVDREAAIAGWRTVVEWRDALAELPHAAGEPILVREVPEDALTSPEPVVETEEAPEDVPPAETPEVVDRDDLRRRIERLQELDDQAPVGDLLERWPISVGLSEAADEDLPLIRRALEVTEAKFEIPFDPPPRVAQPIRNREPEREPYVPPAIAPEEGPDVPPDEVEALGKEWLFVESGSDGEIWIVSLAERAGNLSVSQRPSERRTLIASSLIRMAVAGWHDDEILAAVLDYAQVLAGSIDDPAPILAGLTNAHARRLSAVVGDLVEDRLTFSVGESDGRLRIRAGTENTTTEEVN